MAVSFAPQAAHAGRRIAPEEALTKITEYLESTTEEAYLHPTAILTEGGPTTPAGSANIGLVLHNLQRVQAGLAGKTLGPDLDNEAPALDPVVDLPVDDGSKPSKSAGTRSDVARTVNGAEEADMDWQSSGEFAREQEVLQGPSDGSGLPDDAAGNQYASGHNAD